MIMEWSKKYAMEPKDCGLELSLCVRFFSILTNFKTYHLIRLVPLVFSANRIAFRPSIQFDRACKVATAMTMNPRDFHQAHRGPWTFLRV